MMDYQTYKTYREARAVIDTMRGWAASVSRMYAPDDPAANANGNVYVIKCRHGTSDPMYLRRDGYVR